MRKQVFTVLVTAIVIIGLASEVKATNVLPSTLEYMTEISDLIVVGHVRNVESYWKDRKIFTRISIDVDEYVKYSAEVKGNEVELEVPGGTVGDITFTVDSAPHFEVGEKKMLFLKKAAVGTAYKPFGIFYGVYQVTFDSTLGKEVVHGPYFAHEEHYNPRSMQKVVSTEKLSAEDRNDFKLFKERVKGLVK